ncbi:MAG: prepilin-type N-terminal cleavage/methylation domain-containing protein [Candidatus Moraniibacteriota bacterium]
MEKRGFTLIEILLVFFITGVLLGITFVAIRGQRNKARISSMQQKVESILPLAKECYFVNDTIDTPSSGDPICENVKESWPEIDDENCNYTTASGDSYEVKCEEYGVKFVCEVGENYGCKKQDI